MAPAQLGVRVGGAGPGAAPGGGAAARGAGRAAAAADVRELSRARRPAVLRRDRAAASSCIRRSASSSTPRSSGPPAICSSWRAPARCGRSTSRAATGWRSTSRAARDVRRGPRGVPGRAVRGPARAARVEALLRPSRPRVASTRRSAASATCARRRSTSSRRGSGRCGRCSRSTSTAPPNGVAMYGGGMGELGVGRGQIQLLASLFHPDAPNDVAPPPFNAPDRRRPAVEPARGAADRRRVLRARACRWDRWRACRVSTVGGNSTHAAPAKLAARARAVCAACRARPPAPPPRAAVRARARVAALRDHLAEAGEREGRAGGAPIRGFSAIARRRRARPRRAGRGRWPAARGSTRPSRCRRRRGR